MVWSIDTTQQCNLTVDKHVNFTHYGIAL